MAAITDLATLTHTDLAVGDWLVVHDLSAATDKKMAPFVSGTWTPALSFGGATTGITYSLQSGNYTRMGVLVFVECRIVLTSKGSAAGNATLTGLPFSADGNATPISTFVTGMGSAIAGFSAMIQGGSVSLYYVTGTFTGWSFATDAIFSNTTNLWIGGAYKV